jgi:hypothetical protein
MRWRDIIGEEIGTKPVAAEKPLVLAASRKRAKRPDNINQQIQTTQGMNPPRVTSRRTKREDA